MAEETQFIRWSDMVDETVTQVISRKVINGRLGMVAQIRLAKGARVPKHKHESEQITWILSGALKFRLEDGRELVVSAGEVLVIPSWMEHEATALEDTVDVDIFAPIRRDWIEKTDHYFHDEE